MSAVRFERVKHTDRLAGEKILHDICSLLMREPRLLEEFFLIMSECSSPGDVVGGENSYVSRRYAEKNLGNGTFWTLVSYLADGLHWADPSQLKGTLLELYMSELLRREYNRSGCEVRIRHFVVLDGWRSIKEVDVLAWDHLEKYGEFYECKFTIEANEANELNDCLRNLQMIKRKLQAGIKDSNCAVGFITLQDSESAMNYLTLIVNNPGGSYRILGRDKLAASEFSMR